MTNIHKILDLTPTSQDHEYIAKCPFHKDGMEEHPSFFIYLGPSAGKTRYGTSFCFTCAKGWSLRTLLQELGIESFEDYIPDEVYTHNNHKYSETIILEEEISNVRIPEFYLYTFNFYPKNLLSKGFTKETLDKYEIGFDRSTKRVIFPIRDHLGNLIGISGRAVDEFTYPRYKIYSGELKEGIPSYSFDTNNVLWGLNTFYKEAISKNDMEFVIITEGFKAAMWLSQHGYPNVVALIGVYVSDIKKLLLSRITNKLILFLDNDEPGKKAVEKAIKKLDSHEVLIANYKLDNISPDDLTASDIKEAIETSLLPIEWRIKYERFDVI